MVNVYVSIELMQIEMVQLKARVDRVPTLKATAISAKIILAPEIYQDE